MPSPLRVAFLTHTPPLPLISGERIRNWSLVRELARRGWAVSLFSLLHADTAPSPAERVLLEETCTEVVLAPFRASALGRGARVVGDLVRRRAFQSNFFLSRRAATICERWLDARAFDVVVIGQLYMAPYVSEGAFHHAVLDSHNSEARRVATMTAAFGGSPRGIVAGLQEAAVARFEQEVVARVARVTAVSEEERAHFEELAPGRTDLVPNGVDSTLLHPRATLPAAPRILFLGSLDYSANVDALTHLVDDILPQLVRKDATLSVVGSHPRRAVHAAARRSPIPTTIEGNVPDTTPHWNAARLLVVPLRIAGGTRLKILEALARGVPVVTTSLGCEGLGLRDGEEILVADDPAEFATRVQRLLEDDRLCRSLAERGRAAVEARYDWQMIGDAFERSVSAAAGRR